MIALLSRLYEEKQTTGYFVACEGDEKIFECVTLEPQYNDNKQNNSCIYPGDYWVEKHMSPTFGLCFKVLNTEGRTDILIHSGNFRKNTHGCILPGAYFSDINNDGLKDVTYSNKILKLMLEKMPDRFLMLVR